MSNHDQAYIEKFQSDEYHSVEQEPYNGWRNHATWNVALWIGNDEMIYNHARRNKNLGYRKWAKRFIDEFGEYITGDGVAWLSDDVDQDEMDLVLEEL